MRWHMHDMHAWRHALTWLQLPGAAQRSTTWRTPCRIEKASSICRSLYALRALQPSSLALR